MPKSMKRIAFCFLSSAFVVSIFVLAGCGGGDAQQKEAQQAPQETNQQADQPTPPPPQSSSRLASELIGTWELTHADGFPFGRPPGGHNARVTFSDDGTFELEPGSSGPGSSTPSAFGPGGASDASPIQYSVLDDSRILLTNPEVGEPAEVEYSLEGDTLTLYVYQEDNPEVPISYTWQRNILRIQG